MAILPRHVLRQGPVVATILRAGISALPIGRDRDGKAKTKSPSRVFEEEVPPRHPDLIRDYIRYVGGDPAGYRGTVPPHMFPQWGFPILSKTLWHLPYNIARVVNAGCEMELRQAIPANRPLKLRAQLEEVDDNGKRVILKQRLVTGTGEHSEALISHITAIIPSGRGKKEATRTDNNKKPRIRIPKSAREIACYKLSAHSGIEYAMLTGDLNPAHWLPAYARLVGYKHAVSHGFSLAARVFESLNKSLWAGRTQIIKRFEIKFVSPVVLPNQLKVYLGDGGQFYIGAAPTGPARLTGLFETDKENAR